MLERLVPNHRGSVDIRGPWGARDICQQGSLAGIPPAALSSFPNPELTVHTARPTHSLCPSSGLGKEATSAPIPRRATRATGLGREPWETAESPGRWLDPCGFLPQMKISCLCPWEQGEGGILSLLPPRAPPPRAEQAWPRCRPGP